MSSGRVAHISPSHSERKVATSMQNKRLNTKQQVEETLQQVEIIKVKEYQMHRGL
jgi:hypothetical protein